MNFDEKNIFQKTNYLFFWYVIACYVFQKNYKNSKSLGTLIEYLNVAIRTLEFAIFIEHKKLENIKEIYFNLKIVDVCFYKYFIAIQDEILSNNRDLLEILKR